MVKQLSVRVQSAVDTVRSHLLATVDIYLLSKNFIQCEMLPEWRANLCSSTQLWWAFVCQSTTINNKKKTFFRREEKFLLKVTSVDASSLDESKHFCFTFMKICKFLLKLTSVWHGNSTITSSIKTPSLSKNRLFRKKHQNRVFILERCSKVSSFRIYITF